MQRSILPLVGIGLILLGLTVTGSARDEKREATTKVVLLTPGIT
jgi:hypothetical protein